jgi:membrane protease YdiL (CAAX protease family)
VRETSDLARSRRRSFLILALLAGPLGSLALHIASHLGGMKLPHLNPGASTLLTLLLLAPVLEELVFRGGVQDVLDRTALGRPYVVSGLGVGNLLTSALFAAVHLIAFPSWLAATVFFPSLMFGRLKQLYSSLLPAMLVHAWYNACFLALLNRT